MIKYKRLAIQQQLDAARTQAERNKLGQFATPSDLAMEILEYARSLLPEDQAIRFLDPAIGTGSFLSALLRSFPLTRISSVTGYDIDAYYGQKAIEIALALYLYGTHRERAQQSIPFHPESLKSHRCECLF